MFEADNLPKKCHVKQLTPDRGLALKNLASGINHKTTHFCHILLNKPTQPPHTIQCSSSTLMINMIEDVNKGLNQVLVSIGKLGVNVTIRVTLTTNRIHNGNSFIQVTLGVPE